MKTELRLGVFYCNIQRTKRRTDIKILLRKINQIFLTSECQNVLSSSPNNWDLILGIEGGQMLITGECEANSKL